MIFGLLNHTPSFRSFFHETEVIEHRKHNFDSRISYYSIRGNAPPAVSHSGVGDGIFSYTFLSAFVPKEP